MTKIKKLSNTTINRIAAGEVVERPSSVIKELIENSIDAGADSVTITIESGGKNLIIISDNGCGMSLEELELAIQRHTTSKLDEDDIMNIKTFGFRGEAIPSIASVSKFRISSKISKEEIGNEIYIEGGEVIEKKISNILQGTRIEIRDLFFSTPARLKFLKNDKTESSYCLDIVKNIALSHFKTSFLLISDSKEILKVKSQKDINGRIDEIFGKDFRENSSEIYFEEENIKITGYASIPTYNKAVSTYQYLFVNNRFVKDKLLNIASKIAYKDYLAKDRYPLLVVFVEILPQLVDVNVHPAKTEVRFRDSNEIRNFLISSIKNALQNLSKKVNNLLGNDLLNNHFSKIDDNTQEKIPDAMEPKKSFLSSKDNSRDFSNRLSIFSSKTDFNNDFEKYDYSPKHNTSIVKDEFPSEIKEIKNNLFNKKHDDNLNSDYHKTKIEYHPNIKLDDNEIYKDNIEYPLGAPIAQIHDTYIISQTKDGIILIDQHAAHERLVYEDIKINLKKMNMPTQRLLIPVIVELDNKLKADLFLKNQGYLEKMGLIFKIFSEVNLVVTEVPILLGDFDIKKLIIDLGDHFIDLGTSFALDELIEHVTETYACHHSIRSGRKMNISEMNDLLRLMEKTDFSAQCNHGRPTYVKLNLFDIEKIFGRK